MNLNNKYGYLVTNRKAALDSFKRKIYKQSRGGEIDTSYLIRCKNAYEKLDRRGQYPEYAGIILDYINKKLKSRGIYWLLISYN